MRGVHTALSPLVIVISGSSPHARGPQPRPRFSRQHIGIIPACAGSTQGGQRRRPGYGDHPRMRGVHLGIRIWITGRLGSSPHARGPQQSVWTADEKNRIIPACAGSTAPAAGNQTADQDHPRMRGVHYGRDSSYERHGGSSPHARGPLGNTCHFCTRCRIIPACAGSTQHIIFNIGNGGDHPRMRGVHAASFSQYSWGWGSSPHARGPRFIGEQLAGSEGIIPACAGST